MAARSGRPLNAKVYGQAPAPKPATPVARTGWPPKDNVSAGVRHDRNRGPGQPPKGGLAVGGGDDDQPADAPADPDSKNPRGAAGTYEHRVRQLERELEEIRRARPSSLETHDASLINTDRWMDTLPAWPPPTPPAPAPVDRAAEAMRKKVADYEATLVRKLVSRTPAGPEGAGALRTLTNAFYYYDQANDGLVDLPEFTRVLAKLGCVSALPPSDIVRPLVEGLFNKYATNGQLRYREFAADVLRKSGTRVPAAEATAMEASRQRYDLVAHPWTAADDFQYSTAVRQNLQRRNLEHSMPLDAHQMRPMPRAAWEPRSAAALAAEEAAAYRVPPRSEASGAALRGRLRGGKGGLEDFRSLEEAERKASQRARAQHDRHARAAVEMGRQEQENFMRDAKVNWAKHRTEEERLAGLTPGEYTARQRRPY